MDKWYYESERLIIKRIGEKIDYKIKKGKKNMFEYVRKPFEVINNYLKEPITQKDFKEIFKDDINISHIKICKDDFKFNNQNPYISIICECNGIYKEIVVPKEWKSDGWSEKYKDAGMNFEECASEKAYFLIAPELDEDEIKIELKYNKELNEENKINYNADVVKNQMDIFSFI